MPAAHDHGMQSARQKCRNHVAEFALRGFKFVPFANDVAEVEHVRVEMPCERAKRGADHRGPLRRPGTPLVSPYPGVAGETDQRHGVLRSRRCVRRTAHVLVPARRVRRFPGVDPALPVARFRQPSHA